VESLIFTSLNRRNPGKQTAEEFDSYARQAFELCYKYSEKPEQLKELFTKIDVQIRFTGVRKYWLDDTDYRQTVAVKIIRNNKTIEFDYGMSLKDTWALTSDARALTLKERNQAPQVFIFNKLIKEVKAGLLYDILASVASDYFIGTTFEDFCSEFGYDSDSRKDEATYHNCLVQSAKLKTIFSADDIECLPR
jgi:hypothetical protein